MEKRGVTIILDVDLKTNPSDYLYIGQIPTEIGTILAPDGGVYLALPCTKWNFNGYIREVVVFDRFLSKDEVVSFANKTKEKL